MELDTKTYLLTDRQSQCDFDFDFEFNRFVRQTSFKAIQCMNSSFVVVIRHSGREDARGPVRNGVSLDGHWLWAVIIGCNCKEVPINTIIETGTHCYSSRQPLIRGNIIHLHILIFGLIYISNYVTRKRNSCFIKVHGMTIQMIDILAFLRPDNDPELRSKHVVDNNITLLILGSCVDGILSSISKLSP
jgi:hypothetical protein